jgi:Putative oxalocrotonate tautomerase enzyme
MPLWKIYHPVGACTAEDKHAFAHKITELYGMLPKAGRQFHSSEHWAHRPNPVRRSEGLVARADK